MVMTVVLDDRTFSETFEIGDFGDCPFGYLGNSIILDVNLNRAVSFVFKGVNNLAN